MKHKDENQTLRGERMKNSKTKIAVASALMAASSIASAGGYFGASYLMVDYEYSVLDAEPGAVLLKIGADIHQMVAIEGRLGFGITEDDTSWGDAELDHILGVYAKISPMKGQQFQPYAMFGFAESEGSVGVFSTSGSDMSYGFGCDFEISPGLYGNVEYANYYDKDDEEFSGFSFGVSSKF